MRFCPLLPDSRLLAVDSIELTADVITVIVHSTSPHSRCPKCNRCSMRVHSRYERRLMDLPWQGVSLCLRWRSRRFFCDNSACSRRIFAERCPEIAQAYARKTSRVVKALQAIGIACGGETGARLAKRLGISVSPDCLLRVIRRTALPEAPTPRVLGVDDWAFRRGQRYGTILCDLERHRPIELLPERSSQGLAKWLRDHPGVEIISRDRGDYYIKGATEGAPGAQQVTDRWHLLKNLREALVRLADRHASQIQTAVRAAAEALDKPAPTATSPAKSVETRQTQPDTRAELLSQQRRQRRLERYQEIVQLHEQDISIREIARRLKLHRSTVRRFIRAGCFPERAQRKYRQGTDRFEDYLRQRWDDGCHNAAQLTTEVQERGFKGSYHMVRRCVARWRQTQIGNSNGTNAERARSPTMRRPSSNQIAWLLFKSEAELSSEEETLVIALYLHCPSLELASTLAKEFTDMIKQRRLEQLGDWLKRTRALQGVTELRRFAKGLQDDLAAVKAAFSLSWSNGQTEGHVNRLKTVKRQMYGRAKFDLLRQRFLCAG